MKIIAISGKIGSGKSTLTKHFLSKNTKAEEKFFAENLKKIVCILCNVPYELSLTQEGKNTYIEMFEMTLGEMLQKIGTNLLRDNFDINVWIKSTLSGMKKDGVYIISDCRFKNEAEFIRENGGIIIRINRKDNTTALESGRDLTHASETDLDDFDFDFVIENDGTYQELLEKVDSLYNIIF